MKEIEKEVEERERERKGSDCKEKRWVGFS